MQKDAVNRDVVNIHFMTKYSTLYFFVYQILG